jgi:hypothetical protein
MTPESIPAARLAALGQAEKLDPVIREALRPVFDRLKADAPETASLFAMAMICRALRMLATPPGTAVDANELRASVAAACAAYVSIRPDHP